MTKTNQEKIAEISARVDTIIECCATTPNNFAKILGYNRAQTVYDIQNRKCAPSYDFFNRFTDSEYSVIINLRWLLNGEGEMWTDFMRRLSHDDQITVVDQVNHGISVSSFQMEQTVDRTIRQVELDRLKEENIILRDRAKQAEKQAEKQQKAMLNQERELGRLEKEIEELKRQLQKGAGSVSTEITANVG